MAVPTLQEAIDRAESPVRLLWKANAPRWSPPVVEPEYAGWREEQTAAYETVALSDLCHHISDLFIEGPDALRLLSDHSANSYRDFAVGQAKQSIVVTEEGYTVGDNILTRDGAEKFTMSGVPSSQAWIRYHAEAGGYDVSFSLDPDSRTRGGGDPVLFRYQIQGPRALELVEQVFGGPLPKTKFFHSALVTLGGRTFRALRHGMTGQPGYEFIGEWKDGEFVKQALLEAGESFGLVQVGAWAYSTNALESGWIPMPTPGIYSAPGLRAYRESLPALSFDGLNPLRGSFFSENIQDYYTTPYELGYGRLISFDHDFLGRQGLEQARHDVARERVTLVLDADQARRVWGADGGDLEFMETQARFRVEADDQVIGMAFDTGTLAPRGTVLSLALVDRKYATPGTEVTFVWGEHPGPGTDPDDDRGFERIKATVQASPYNEYVRTRYRAND
ncbi:aminomethyl transferase family protein [Streptomyces sp. NBC_00582]|uniref:aminomethyl transferase family protein n=1 Tax=Streptomyces sp. NBC_00582 TaxID=2975783 RepID=UPI002E819FE5|nr:aminomethyl transferase family protein [Streptomyces sp. NBC_00582]WUB67522.1 aminomethyl transferase family protein [Streptomyces sp. NBC_00582]